MMRGASISYKGKFDFTPMSRAPLWCLVGCCSVLVHLLWCVLFVHFLFGSLFVWFAVCLVHCLCGSLFVSVLACIDVSVCCCPDLS
mmetsp:Transcript_39664/g.79907  ORF Transcript_39664/g.79907 Transcript_39664/m.79907 type:complete len:86 (+) Transcript_39664:108-365(+)